MSGVAACRIFMTRGWRGWRRRLDIVCGGWRRLANGYVAAVSGYSAANVASLS